MRMLFSFTATMVLLFCTLIPLQAAEHRLGGGANYWMTIDDIKDGDKEFDNSGLGFIASYQYWPSLIGLELDLEFLPDRFGETAMAPQGWLLVGRSIYAGAGIGITYSDSSFADQPFFGLRAGFNLELLPGIYGDIYGQYRFSDKAQLDNSDTDIDTDTVFLGAAVRLAL